MPIPNPTIIGNLTADPELRFTQAGKAYANLTIAANDRYKDATTGEWKDGDTTFVRATIWGPLAEAVNGTLHKGSKVIAVGRLRQHNYETKEGEKRSSLELDVQEIGAAVRPAKQAATTDSWATAQPPAYDSDIPF